MFSGQLTTPDRFSYHTGWHYTGCETQDVQWQSGGGNVRVALASWLIYPLLIYFPGNRPEVKVGRSSLSTKKRTHRTFTPSNELTYPDHALERGGGGALEGIIRKLVRLGCLPLSTPTFEVLCNKADSNPFACIWNDTCPMTCISCYHRLGSLAIPCAPDLKRKCFLTRMLYMLFRVLLTHQCYLNFIYSPINCT